MRDEEGKFKRIHKVWTPRNMNDGYVDKKGRFLVYYPKHSRASPMGYVLRAIIHYEHYHKKKVGRNHEVHHINKDRLDDSKKNLVRLTKRQHHKLHNYKILAELLCQRCGKKFTIRKWRLRELGRGKYCSQKCYHKYPRTEKHKKNIGKGLKKAYKEGRR